MTLTWAHVWIRGQRYYLAEGADFDYRIRREWRSVGRRQRVRFVLYLKDQFGTYEFGVHERLYDAKHEADVDSGIRRSTMGGTSAVVPSVPRTVR